MTSEARRAVSGPGGLFSASHHRVGGEPCFGSNSRGKIGVPRWDQILEPSTPMSDDCGRNSAPWAK